ncbi:DUF2182 domain-containing protein [Limibaculum sp. M0105]|uniref:DUF2182 domain-containing protein n=1 Tax=Thermohalobaculum xanthum TaxID=2753746 RepID=A0A8J7M5J5_9RHOB|nr:DUF2182 domain-containing protein [Thermohalobaculum xanthum]MBK0398706.1 DUF2182 domain-containing protein [Thermohalobaculum xanthum]
MSAVHLSQRPRLMAWLGVGLAAGAGWLALAAMDPAVQSSPLAALAELCMALEAPALAQYPAVAAMWLLMSVAMMLPTAAPAIDLYARLSRRIERGRLLCLAGFAGGYVAAWGGFGLVAAGAQIAIAGAATNATAGATGTLAGALLVLAGAYQLTPLKAACLTLCRNPLAFFMAQWREGPLGATGMGLRHGLICIGCCWALMGLMLVAGAMNLIWMAGLGALMLAEKTLPGADRAGRVIGVALAFAGAALIVDANI